ncbi:MAG: glycine cleavage system H protein [Gammaproteobacteria bacterium]|nr:MAG: glycine cleavage system protein GcvH [Pseudomonadota bacterium]MBC6945707.1 glycine cleavage system protein GcvH [Gammaproteobacteria bacterium]MCE7896357.1 glycine cleavage system protein GcvH [Gammaproteobacteria bacterium PRO8]MDL1881368.1 glycine cleavage system protein GcvH [Gammaproteobacteria bacterium PRO2]MCL4777927.1 glycine cleavage system protein GcvH [Gammaproteobacteria bacterium]
MSAVPGELKYTRDHEWLRQESDGTVVVGITDHAQQQLGELVFVELPEAGATLAAGQGCAVVESVKAASDVYAPLAGTVVAVNDALEQEPGLVNSSPYGDGWLLRIAPATAVAGLLDAAAYQQVLAAEG